MATMIHSVLTFLRSMGPHEHGDAQRDEAGSERVEHALDAGDALAYDDLERGVHGNARGGHGAHDHKTNNGERVHDTVDRAVLEDAQQAGLALVVARHEHEVAATEDKRLEDHEGQDRAEVATLERIEQPMPNSDREQECPDDGVRRYPQRGP